MRPFLTRLFLFIIAPSIGLIIFFCIKASSSLPDISGTIYLNNIDSQITIRRDSNGIPAVTASKDENAYFGLGYVHAQDRMWQLEVQRRLAGGTLSEIFGASALKTDVYMRTLAFYERAEKDWSSLSKPAQRSLKAYTKGINAWLEQKRTLPIEFQVLGVKPAPWSEIDSLAWMKVFGMGLSGNLWSEIRYLYAKERLDAAKLSTFYAGILTDQEVALATPPQLSDLYLLDSQLNSKFNVGGQFVGSNAWVVKSTDGKKNQALLANDVHLDLQIPSVWYFASIAGDKIRASGFTLVGLPLIIFGKNENIAWGGTNMMADTQDLFFETVRNNNPNQYLYRGEWHNFQKKLEKIRVRPEPPQFLNAKYKDVEVEIRSTERGPIVSEAHGFSAQAASLRWTLLENTDTSFEAFFQLGYASDWESFREALKLHISPALNMLYVDKKGNIGYQGIGRIPIRQKGSGRAPISTDLDDYGWVGHIPFEEMPMIFNPEKGYIISANDFVSSKDNAYHISDDWAPPFRALRIKELLDQYRDNNQKISLEEMMSIQKDNKSLDSVPLLNALKSTKTSSTVQQRALQYVKEWNGEMSINSVGATIFYEWSRQIRIELFDDEMSPPYGKEYQKSALTHLYTNTTDHQVANALTDMKANWCDDIDTQERVEKCEEIILIALDKAINELGKQLGSDTSSWLWGNIHHTVYSHIPFSETNLLRPIFEVRTSNGGGPNTINMSSSIYSKSKGYEQKIGAAFRQIIALDDNSSKHIFMNSTGQSGNIFSKHYDDMTEPFSRAEYLDSKAIEVRDILLLKPQPNN